MSWAPSPGWQSDAPAFEASSLAWQPERAHWWEIVLETSWATESAIDEACGPEYRMYLNQPPA